MDWDGLVARLAGTEGAPRYVRTGLFLLAASLVGLSSILLLPLHVSGDVSLTYLDLRSDPEATPFAVANSVVVWQANLALLGCAFTAIVGLVFVLEGRRVIDLRRILVWHAEARATALNSLAAMVALVALAGLASIWGVVATMPSMVSMGGTVVEQDVSSPGTILAMAVMGLAVASMVFLSYYSCVLSVYRGGATPRTRHMARLAMMLAITAIVAILALRMGPLATATIQMGVGPGSSGELDLTYTQPRVHDQGADASQFPLMAGLSVQLSAAQVMLALAVLLALVGMAGVSAHSLGGEGLRVRRAASLPAVAVFLVAFASFFTMAAMGVAPAALREVLGSDSLPVSLGWGLWLGVVLAIVAVAVTIWYLFRAGTEYIVGGFAFWRGEERALEVGPAAEAPMSAGFGGDTGTAATTGPPPPQLRPGRPPIPRTLKALLTIIVVVIVILAASVGLSMMREPPGGGGSGREPVVVEQLTPFDVGSSTDVYLSEGEWELLDVLDTVLGAQSEEMVLFVNSVRVEVEWQDEPDAGILWTNQEDTFSVSVVDSGRVFTEGTDTGSNPQGGMGTLSAFWDSAEFWLAWGNLSIVDTGDADVISEGTVLCEVSMDEAGDQVTRLGRTQTDGGNGCTVRLRVTGTMYVPQASGQ